jgi:hypothetical protein
MISKLINKIIYLIRISPVLISLILLNILFTILTKLTSFKNTIRISKKKTYFIFNPFIKIKHLIIFQDLISNLFPYNTCLVKALSIHKLSMMMGIRTKVFIGIAEKRGSLISHAWIEIDGTCYYEDAQKKYLPILDY